MTKRRCVVVWGPDFDAPGKEGIEAAQEHARQLQEICRQIPDQLAANGMPADQVQAARALMAEYRHVVRKVDL